ncbi:glucosamine-fructose-6-phosphate aminotransferase [Dehalogenimonas sp. WBC-2]|nr:glucosamine-fructose-6-phosphate aminotransferase [Dehalogenimonas sp. WBC-2]
MCGLTGYCGHEPAAPKILQGLKLLEYRGYDSAGLATLHNNKITSRKAIGHLKDVESKQNLSQLKGQVGIGHVRWATHGRATELNAHPQLDCLGGVAVVHNGVIENATELRTLLSGRHRFVSDTDTEVIPHLIADHLREGLTLSMAAQRTAGQLQGPYAFLVITESNPDIIVACCKDMPLLIGIGDAGNYAASDVISFSGACSQFMVLDHGEVAVISAKEVKVYDQWNQQIIKPLEIVESKWQQTNATEYPYFMYKEIIEQPWAISQALLQNFHQLNQIATLIQNAEQVIFTACGTSRHAALLGRYLFSKVGKRFSDVIIGSEFMYYTDSITDGTLVIAVSQSGETADIIEGVRAARQQGAKIVSIVNRPNTQLSRLSDHVLHLNCGPETSVAATKSFTAELVIFYLLSHAMIGELESVTNYLREVADLIEENILHNNTNIEALAYEQQHCDKCYFIARGSNLHIATEAALKLKEIAYVHSEGMPAGELKHGTLALVEEGTPFMAICPHDHTFQDVITNVNEAKSRGAYIIGVSDQCDPIFDKWIEIPTVDPLYFGLVSIIPLQLFAYYSALARGLNPDKPRNLAKSVTVK